MEKKIIHHLLFSCFNFEEQAEAVKSLRTIPEEFYDQETRIVLRGIEFSHKMKKLATEKTISTYFQFNKEKFDIDDYFWFTDEKEANQIVLEDACKLFVKQKEIEINKHLVEKALNEYEKTGKVSVLSEIDLQSSERKKAVKSIEEATTLGLKKLEDIKNKKDTKRIKFSNSFFYMNTILKGLEPGELIIMAARPSVGKTAFSLGFMNDFSKQGKKTMFISLEMYAEELIERMLTAKTGIPRNVFFSQTGFTDEKFLELKKAALELNKQPITIADESPAIFTEIMNLIKEEHRKKGLDVAFVDYLGLISSYAGEESFSTRETVSKISGGFKRLAMELQIPIVLMQQVNRNVASGHREDSSFKELQLTDLRDSGSLEQDANKVFLLWNLKPETEKDKEDIANSKYKVVLNIAKNRNGQSNQKVLFEFNKAFQRIKETDWLTKPSTWVSKND